MSIWITDENGQTEYPDMGSVIDGYHTFDELYEARTAKLQAVAIEVARLRGRMDEVYYIRENLTIDVTEPTNANYLSKRLYELEDRIKQMAGEHLEKEYKVKRDENS